MIEKELPKEVIEKMRREIRNHQKYRALKEKKNTFIKNKNFILALQIQKEIDNFEAKTLKTCIELYQKRVKSMAGIVSQMDSDDSKLMTAYSYSIIMIADVMETIVSEIGQLSKKYAPDFTFHAHDEFVKLGKDIKNYLSILKGFGGNDEYHLNLYCNTTDGLTEMIVNKAKSFMNKIDYHEDNVRKKNS